VHRPTGLRLGSPRVGSNRGVVHCVTFGSGKPARLPIRVQGTARPGRPCCRWTGRPGGGYDIRVAGRPSIRRGWEMPAAAHGCRPSPGCGLVQKSHRDHHPPLPSILCGPPGGSVIGRQGTDTPLFTVPVPESGAGERVAGPRIGKSDRWGVGFAVVVGPVRACGGRGERMAGREHGSRIDRSLLAGAGQRILRGRSWHSPLHRRPSTGTGRPRNTSPGPTEVNISTATECGLSGRVSLGRGKGTTGCGNNGQGRMLRSG